MPKYDFRCPKCSRVEEFDYTDPGAKCECSGEAVDMKRVYAFGGTLLKGSGWYSVDKRRTDGGTIGIEDPT
jgi:predicted nucleic acid-binding Zn ribbon protein